MSTLGIAVVWVLIMLSLSCAATNLASVVIALSTLSLPPYGQPYLLQASAKVNGKLAVEVFSLKWMGPFPRSGESGLGLNVIHELQVYIKKLYGDRHVSVQTDLWIRRDVGGCERVYSTENVHTIEWIGYYDSCLDRGQLYISLGVGEWSSVLVGTHVLGDWIQTTRSGYIREGDTGEGGWGERGRIAGIEFYYSGWRFSSGGHLIICWVNCGSCVGLRGTYVHGYMVGGGGLHTHRGWYGEVGRVVVQDGQTRGGYDTETQNGVRCAQGGETHTAILYCEERGGSGQYERTYITIEVSGQSGLRSVRGFVCGWLCDLLELDCVTLVTHRVASRKDGEVVRSDGVSTIGRGDLDLEGDVEWYGGIGEVISVLDGMAKNSCGFYVK
ncbi:hypothetical protein Tco_0168142 [Tanacetum coccineum]